MATYSEIDELLAPDEPTGLRRRVAIGTMVAADAIRQEVDDGTKVVRERKRFAQLTFQTMFNPSLGLSRDDDSDLAFISVFEGVYRAVLIANLGASKSAITGASDSAVQAAVNDAVDLLAANFPDPVIPEIP